jgi:hypothetical protein
MPEPDRRRWLRRPRFSLLLSALVGAAALAIVLAGNGGPGTGRSGTHPAPTPSGGRVRACVTTAARSRYTAGTTVTALGKATVPLRVSETVVGRRAAVTVTRGGSFTARVTTGRHISVTDHAAARGRRCAFGPSLTAARGLALRQAYAVARIRARHNAEGGAQRSLASLKRRVYPLVQAEARSAALRRAQASALAARPSLIRAARRQARRRAG